MEIKIRFGNNASRGSVPAGLVWDSYFDLREPGAGKAKYPLGALAGLSREETARLLEDYFRQVYFTFYSENGIGGIPLRDPAALAGWSCRPTPATRRLRKGSGNWRFDATPTPEGTPGASLRSWRITAS